MLEEYRAYDEKIREIYRSTGMQHLHELKFGETNAAGYMIDIVRSKNIYQPMQSSEFKIAHEMDFITCDIKYIAGVLLLLRPYINNNHLIQTYYQTIEDRRYLMYTAFGLQAVYNFWDRLGDLLWHYFPTKLAERDVFFDRVIKAIEPQYMLTEPYKKIVKLYEDEVKPVMAERKETVHYFQPEARHYWGNVEDYGNNKKTLEMYNQKYAYADMMKNQLKISCDAFKLTIELIEQLPDK